MRIKGTTLGFLLAAGLGVLRAHGADLPLDPRSASAEVSWAGLYLGGHFGYGVGRTQVRPAQIDSGGGIASFPHDGMLGGFQVGYHWVVGGGFVIGAEADITFADYWSTRRAPIGPGGAGAPDAFSRLEYLGAVRGRLGHAFGRVLPYVSGGLAWAENRLDTDSDTFGSTQSLAHVGWTLGAGVEVAVNSRWSAKAEYNVYGFAPKTYDAVLVDPGAGPGVRIAPTLHALRLGLNYRLLDGGGRAPPDPDDSAWQDWNIHGQTTLTGQGYPRFYSPYEGPHSLIGASQARNTITATAFIGRRLWEGAEFYINPELDQGFGLSDTLGAGGFPNGEAQKSNFPYVHPTIPRAFIRQTFGLGGEQENIENGANSLPGKRDVSRVTITAGKFAVNDIFDDNAYAHDPRSTFMNWSIWEAGAFDYPADTLGYTYGAVAELNQKSWAVRAGAFLMPVESNVNRFDTRFPERGAYIAELETRYALWNQGGKLRLGAWITRSNAGSYAETLANPLFGVDIAQTRQVRSKYGYYANIEQAITSDLGVFSRLSWNNGQTEIMAFTDIDASASFGAVLKGTTWGRPNDRIGVAGAVNALSPEHRAFVAAGGLGVLIGDGRLNYRDEIVFETYYAIAFTQAVTLTLDYQHLTNPAYNADRGPVSIYAARLHAEF